jgi:DNA-binding NarL/FixJ family response regulator
LTKLRLIVADDSPLFLQKLISLLAVEFDVVATAADGKTALDLIRRYEPDLVVLDLQMPALNGIEVTRELAKNPASPPVVICSAETDPEIVEAAREAGAVEYVFKARIETDLTLAAKSAVQKSSCCGTGSQSSPRSYRSGPFSQISSVPTNVELRSTSTVAQCFVDKAYIRQKQ